MSFRRTFALLILLVVLPSAGLSGFGVVAIMNERAAVQKRLEAAWQARLEPLAAQVIRVLESSPVRVTAQGLEVLGPQGRPLSDGGFSIHEGEPSATDGRLLGVLGTVQEELLQFPMRPRLLSAPGVQGTTLLMAQRREGNVLGARLSEKALAELVRELGQGVVKEGELVQVELWATTRDAGETAMGRFLSQVEQARQVALGPPSPLAERTLPVPLQDFRLVAVPTGPDPVARASARNRAVYGVLLGAFYLVLATGVVYVGRTLYREAKLSRMKTDFVSLVSHELRTPLTSIRMFIETLALGRVEEGRQTREVLALLLKETERLSGMIEGVLDWARIEGGQRTYRRQVWSVQEVLDAALDAFRVQRLDAPVQLGCEVAAGLPPVNVDREALAGALLNLLQNAVKYSGEDKRIQLRARPEGRGVAIDVEDNGIGISARDRKRIFERFYRVDSLLTRRTEGFGLGLAIARRIVEAHGGRLSLRSELGEGSCFTLHLPAGKPSPEAST